MVPKANWNEDNSKHGDRHRYECGVELPGQE
jgi:hypothetical protein